MKKKDALSSPFQNPHRKTADPKGDRDDVYDHNTTPQFSQPHTKGPDTIPVVFEEGELGKSYRGDPAKNAAKISSPMGGGKK